MNWGAALTVYAKELRDSLRDRRTIISMIVVPTLIMPGLIFGAVAFGTKVAKKAKAEASSIVIIGGADSPQVVSALKADPRFRIIEDAPDYRELISQKRIRAAIEIPAGFEQALRKGEAAAVTIYHYEGEMRSGFGVAELSRFLSEIREKTIGARLVERGLPETLVKPFEIKRQNVAPPEKVGGNLIGGIVPYLIIVLCFTGAMYPAIDLTAGEKERGTMETLLCSPVPRSAIVVGKFLMVLTASLGTMLFCLVSMSASFFLGGALFLPKSAGAAAAAASGAMPRIDPVGILGVFAMILPVAVLFSAALLTIALFAKSYKEAQTYISPMIILLILPATMGMLPGVELNASLALVPILNLSLICKEMLSGVWNWPYIALIFGSTAVYAAAALGIAVAMFKRESVIFRS